MRLYSPEFAADPHGAYRNMRRDHGPLVPIDIAPGVPATLVLGYREALHIFGDPARFPADPRLWESRQDNGCPYTTAMGWQPTAARTAGDEHTHYRHAVTTALDRVDLHAVRSMVERTAITLINDFCRNGAADLLNQYAVPLTIEIVDELLGFTPETGDAMFDAMMTLRDNSAPALTAQADAVITDSMRDLITLKRATPGHDITSWLLADPAALDDAETAHAIAMLYTAGTEPTWNLIANTLLLMVTDNRFGSELLGGALSARDAIDEALFADPPLANSCITYPRQPQLLGDVWLPEHQPVVISLAGCHDDPTVHGERTGNRSHLAWGAGPHACPAQSVAMLIANEALDQLLDALPDLELAQPATELTWRPGPFHRALTALPVTFPPSLPLNYL
ncbi:cytochrome P450 [Nocardia sp. NEAU-G5]|uniref:Cytochrome P450 n=1 Tax=Nocardia albiluteola TaxID=2842303 RepID=A0ABS6B335_9NOCA|nr:cytochrome P450 [Nocardia albiluteola]MBU3064712.1 cytochrome P450 [Nocardia albiluteola]